MSEPVFDSPQSLSAHTAHVRRDLELLGYPRRSWLTAHTAPDGQKAYDVLIVGGGQGGLAAAFGLMRERIDNLLVVDENALDHAGPWRSFARMRTLRTPKYLTGPDLGIPSLTPQAWYEAAHGAGSWDVLGLLPKETWADYLRWYRETLDIPVRADTQVGALRFDAASGLWEVPCRTHGRAEVLWARRVVLATGIDGSGAWQIPKLVSDSLPESHYAHSRWDIDFEALRGKRIAVLGAGASAFDNAATALERGAREVRLFFRRTEQVAVNPYRWAEFVGFLKHLGDLSDADKWRFISQILRMGQLPPADTFRRASELPGFHLQPGAGFRKLSITPKGDIAIETEKGDFEADYLIVATGFVTDLGKRPELANVAELIARWQDRFTPPAGEAHEDLARHPYLGANFEFVEREPGTAPYLSTLYNYTFGGLLSLGFGGASISGLKYSVPRLVAGITRSFFVEDREAHYTSLCNFSEKEF